MNGLTIRAGTLRAVCALLTVMTLAGTTAVATAKVSRTPKHHRSHHVQRHRAGIPQHNGGDHDSDNNGSPSDGDGNQ